MAEAKDLTQKKVKKTGGDEPPKLTKRKAGLAKKTKTKKVKIVKRAETDVNPQAVALAEKPAEQILTARRQRVTEKAAARIEHRAQAPEVETVASMKLTEFDSREYTPEEYKRLLDMYDEIGRAHV